jgi:hypothetical protein
MSNHGQRTRECVAQEGGLVVVEATEDSLSNRARPHVVQLGAGLTRAAPYQRFRNRFISKASLRRSMW